MSVGEDFGTFCSNLVVTNRSSISDRYESITTAIPIRKPSGFVLLRKNIFNLNYL